MHPVIGPIPITALPQDAIPETQPRGRPPALAAGLGYSEEYPRTLVPAPPPYRYGRTPQVTHKGAYRRRMQRACIPEAGTPRRRKVGELPCSASADGSPLGLDIQASDTRCRAHPFLL